MIDFKNISYLQFGNDRQKAAYYTLTKFGVMDKLFAFDPILVGTIPIDIDVENSDLDIICYMPDPDLFRSMLNDTFGSELNFQVSDTILNERRSVIAKFLLDDFEVEIFGQDLPSALQNGYLHMVIEHDILCERGSAFRERVRALKAQGFRTEPAFAKLLGLSGDPYKELLKMACRLK